MSDYLVNLARRSAGLTPVIRARAPLPPVIAAVADAAAFGADGSVERTVVSPAPVVAPPTPVSIAAARLPVAPVAVAQATPMPVAPLVQRVPVVAASAPSPAGATATRNVNPPPTTVPAPAPLTVRIAPAPSSRMVAAEARPAPASLPPAAPRAAIDVSATARAPIARVDAPRDLPREEPRRAIIGAEPRIVERVVGTAEMRFDAPAVRVEPASRKRSLVPPAVLRAEPPAPSERTVHVRIGSIEIHGAESAPAAPPTSPVAAPSGRAPNGGGFDDFARLRSYTPWRW